MEWPEFPLRRRSDLHHTEWNSLPGRSGNDPADFTADLLGAFGAFAGTLVLPKCHRLIA